MGNARFAEFGTFRAITVILLDDAPIAALKRRIASANGGHCLIKARPKRPPQFLKSFGMRCHFAW